MGKGLLPLTEPGNSFQLTLRDFEHTILMDEATGLPSLSCSPSSTHLVAGWLTAATPAAAYIVTENGSRDTKKYACERETGGKRISRVLSPRRSGDIGFLLGYRDLKWPPSRRDRVWEWTDESDAKVRHVTIGNCLNPHNCLGFSCFFSFFVCYLFFLFWLVGWLGGGGRGFLILARTPASDRVLDREL